MNTRGIQKSFKSIFKHFPKNYFATAETATTNNQAILTPNTTETYDLYQRSTAIARSALAAAADKTITKIQDIKFPFNFKAIKSLISISVCQKKDGDDLAFPAERIPDVEEKMKEIFHKFMKGLTTKNVDDFPDIESNFLLSVLESLETLKKNKISVTTQPLKNESEFRQKNLTESLKIFERMYLNGVVVERAFNAPKEEYMIFDPYQEFGLMFFGVKESFVEDPARKFKFSWEVEKNPVSKKNLKQMVLRTYVQYTSPYVLRVARGQNEEQEYTFMHSAVIENQLHSAPAGSLASLSIGDWLKKFRLSDKWVLTDFDGAFGGNPFLVPEAQHSKLVHTKNRFKDL